MARNILFVDDDITSLDIMAILFEKNGFEVLRSADATQAIDSAQKNSPDIIVVDLMMPEIDGVTAVKKIRENGYNKPVIAFTASNDIELHNRAIEAGCAKVLTKPCKAQTLVQSVNDLVEEK
jgi:CheY-like chemotaxis protein